MRQNNSRKRLKIAQINEVKEFIKEAILEAIVEKTRKKNKTMKKK